MHAKLLLLSHPSHLRICVPSANLVPYDVSEIPNRGWLLSKTLFLEENEKFLGTFALGTVAPS